MGTRGCYGVRIDGKDHLTYNHFDSYPAGLGADIVDAIHAKMDNDPELADWRQKARNLRAVNTEDIPTEADIKQYLVHADLNVSSKSPSDWYCLLRNVQGNIAAMLDLGIYIDNHQFMQDSPFCEWAYIINFDDSVLEIYKGFQVNPHNIGRYAKLPGVSPGYVPVKLIAQTPLNEVTRAFVCDCETD